MKENNQFILPIESVEIRSAKDSSPKRRIRAKAKLVPGKEYAYLFEYDKDKRPKLAKKEIFSNEGWERIKKKILSKRIFVDENHKTVASMNIDKWLNQLARETGKDLTELKKKINELILGKVNIKHILRKYKTIKIYDKKDALENMFSKLKML